MAGDRSTATEHEQLVALAKELWVVTGMEAAARLHYSLTHDGRFVPSAVASIETARLLDLLHVVRVEVGHYIAQGQSGGPLEKALRAYDDVATNTPPSSTTEFVLVPREATAEMVQAAEDRHVEGASYIAENSIQFALWREVWKAMLRAAPVVKPPSIERAETSTRQAVEGAIDASKNREATWDAMRSR